MPNPNNPNLQPVPQVKNAEKSQALPSTGNQPEGEVTTDKQLEDVTDYGVFDSDEEYDFDGADLDSEDHKH